MTKQDALWVSIRFLGLYVLVHALFAIPQGISSAFAIVAIHHADSQIDSSEKDTTAEAATTRRLMRSLVLNSLHDFADAAARFILYTIAGLYMVRNGTLLFHCVNRTERTEPAGNLP